MLYSQNLELRGLGWIIGVDVDANDATADDAKIVARITIGFQHLA
jgi:hypothetical protein